MSKALQTMPTGKPAPFDLTKPPKLPPVLNNIQALKAPQELVELTQQMLGSADTSEFDLKRYRVGRGGSTNWLYEEFGEEATKKEITGIMLATAVRRAWYSSREVTGAPPDCSSADGMVGFGVLPKDALAAMGKTIDDGDKSKGGKGYNCADCPFAQFGSGRNDAGEPTKGQACRMARAIYVLCDDDNVPSVVVLPPTSLGSSKKFLNSFLMGGIPLYGMKVVMKLEKHTGGGNPHARAVFGLDGKKENAVIPRDSPWFAFLASLSEFVKVSMLPQFRVTEADLAGESDG